MPDLDRWIGQLFHPTALPSTVRELDEAHEAMHPGQQRHRISRDEITRHLAALGDITAALATAEPADKAAMYGQLGLSLTYHPGAMRVDVAVRPLSGMYVRKCPRTESPLVYMPAITGELVLGGQR